MSLRRVWGFGCGYNEECRDFDGRIGLTNAAHVADVGRWTFASLFPSWTFSRWTPPVLSLIRPFPPKQIVDPKSNNSSHTSLVYLENSHLYIDMSISFSPPSTRIENRKKKKLLFEGVFSIHFHRPAIAIRREEEKKKKLNLFFFSFNWVNNKLRGFGISFFKTKIPLRIHAY